jgi:hypothetical protein
LLTTTKDGYSIVLPAVKPGQSCSEVERGRVDRRLVGANLGLDEEAERLSGSATFCRSPL